MGGIKYENLLKMLLFSLSFLLTILLFVIIIYSLNPKHITPMPTEQIKQKKTSTPVQVLVGEAMLLHSWCQDDKDILISAGLDWEIVNALPDLCQTCQSIHAECEVEMISLARYRRELRIKFAEGIRLRSAIAEKIRFALYMAESKIEIPVYHRRRAYPEIIGDLYNLAGMCEHFREMLEQTGFDFGQIDILNTTAGNLQSENLKLFEMNLDYRELRKTYLPKYNELYDSVRLIRKCAFEISPPQSFRRKGYQSQYRKAIKCK